MGRSPGLGPRGEAMAAEHLEGAGWSIVDRNFRAGRKEIDLVARRGGVVAFIEVKARSGPRFGDPLEAITPCKQREVQEVASVWIQRHGRDGDVYRFDAVAVWIEPGAEPRVEHLEDAWGI